MLRGVSKCVHLKPGGHRLGEVQRHLPATAGPRVADPLPRCPCDHRHVDAVGTAHGALPRLHCRAANGAPGAAVRASLAQCEGSANLVRVPIPGNLFPTHPMLRTIPPEAAPKNYHSNSLSAPTSLGFPFGASPQFSGPSQQHPQSLETHQSSAPSSSAVMAGQRPA